MSKVIWSFRDHAVWPRPRNTRVWIYRNKYAEHCELHTVTDVGCYAGPLDSTSELLLLLSAITVVVSDGRPQNENKNKNNNNKTRKKHPISLMLSAETTAPTSELIALPAPVCRRRPTTVVSL